MLNRQSRDILNFKKIISRIGAEPIGKEKISNDKSVNLSQMENKQAGTYTRSSQPVAVG